MQSFRFENIILYITSFFLIIGAIDYILGNKMKLGSHFEAGVKTMGPLALSMIGILSFTPILSIYLKELLSPFAAKIGIDPSTFSSMFLAVDMGGYNIALDIGSSAALKNLSGVLIASTIGATLSFTLPLSLGLIKKDHLPFLAKGILCGIITTPIGIFVGGILLKIDIYTLIMNIMPLIILSVALSLMLIYFPDICIKVFKLFGQFITIISIVGFTIQGVSSISGIEIISGLMSLSEILTIVGKVAIFLGGAYVFIEVIKRTFNKQLKRMSDFFNVTVETIALLIGSLASNIVVFASFDELDDRGKIICSSFAVSGAFVLGGQLGYVAGVEPSIINIYMITKLISGICAVILSSLLYKTSK